jgi:menaquinone-9 beta-reductase
MLDCLIVGAGPAGAIAGLVLARAGARVRIVDRAAFPRDKLCGDTVNPGTLALLARLGLSDAVERCGLPVAGMRISGHGGIVVEARYPPPLCGRALVRRDFDWLLVQHAVAAGCEFEPQLAVGAASIDNTRGEPQVVGVRLGAAAARELRARVTIAADGRHSTLAFELGLARHPIRPRRWAIGAYVESASRGDEWLGEMHIRPGRYIGIAPLAHGVTNVCLVKPSRPGDADLHNPAAFLRREIAADSLIRDRLGPARFVAAPVVLGPVAVDAVPRPIDGLLLAGDAAGFIDPMTGDGLRFAVQGGELAAAAALEALEHGWPGVHARLAARRRRAFAGKSRFNRALRALVESRRAVGLATAAARIAPSVVRRLVGRAGDCDLALEMR